MYLVKPQDADEVRFAAAFCNAVMPTMRHCVFVLGSIGVAFALSLVLIIVGKDNWVAELLCTSMLLLLVMCLIQLSTIAQSKPMKLTDACLVQLYIEWGRAIRKQPLQARAAYRSHRFTTLRKFNLEGFTNEDLQAARRNFCVRLPGDG